jgi:hypothetical protein
MFEEALLKNAAPRLKAQGYEYDPALRDGDMLFGLRKQLGDDVQVVIQFQLTRTGDAFTVNLIRAKTNDIQPRLYGGYEGALGGRLSHVLWFVHQLRTHSQSEHWWAAGSCEELQASLVDVVDQLKRYGIPWLEDPRARKPWEMPTHRGAEFRSALQLIVAPELDRLGYRLETQLLAWDYPYPYFVKPLVDDELAFIEFRQVYSLDPDRFEFDVRLQRKWSRDPLNVAESSTAGQQMSLGQLVWMAQGSPSAAQDSIAAAKSLTWYYRNRSELEAQLLAALEQVERHGIVWLEDRKSG